MQENKFSSILGLCLYAKPNNCMQLWNKFSQLRDIFFDILSMSFPHSHWWSFSANSWIPLLGSCNLKQKLMRPNKTEDGLVYLILCSHKVLRKMLCNVLVYICKDLVFFLFFCRKKHLRLDKCVFWGFGGFGLFGINFWWSMAEESFVEFCGGFFDEGVCPQYIEAGCTRYEDNFQH